MQPPGVENASTAPAQDDVQRELDTVLSSDAFRRSERQSKFLRFVCELTLNGDAAKINEYLIAYEVFGRGPEYSPGEDSVVRRQAHALRQKLQDYYAGEGSDHAIRIELPVGRYVPVFARKEPVSPGGLREPAAETFEPAESVAVAPRRRRLTPVLWVAGAIAAGWLLGHFTARAPQNPALSRGMAELWSEWLSDPAGASICFSNPVTAVVKQFPEPLPPNSLPRRIPMTRDEEKQFRDALDIRAGGYLYLSPALSQAKMGEALGAIGITAMFARSGVPVRGAQSRFLSWENFRNQNLILLGHDEANRWLDPLMQKLPFRLAATEGDKPRRIVNTAPRGHEPAEYRIEFASRKDDPRVDYALITMMRGLDGKHLLLLINGLNTEGTQAACEYLVGARTVDDLLSRFRAVDPKHRGPWHFQAVLKTEVHDVVPIKASLLAVRVL